MSIQDILFYAAIDCLACCLLWGNFVCKREEKGLSGGREDAKDETRS